MTPQGICGPRTQDDRNHLAGLPSSDGEPRPGRTPRHKAPQSASERLCVMPGDGGCSDNVRRCAGQGAWCEGHSGGSETAGQPRKRNGTLAVQVELRWQQCASIPERLLTRWTMLTVVALVIGQRHRNTAPCDDAVSADSEPAGMETLQRESHQADPGQSRDGSRVRHRHRRQYPDGQGMSTRAPAGHLDASSVRQ